MELSGDLRLARPPAAFYLISPAAQLQALDLQPSLRLEMTIRRFALRALGIIGIWVVAVFAEVFAITLLSLLWEPRLDYEPPPAFYWMTVIKVGMAVVPVAALIATWRIVRNGRRA